jgi:putative flippase GtrA
VLRSHGRKAVSFLVIGGGVFVLGQGILLVLVGILQWPEVSANAVQLAITFAINFALNSLLTWKDRQRTFSSIVRFVTSRGATVLLTFGLFAVLVQYCNCNYLVANAIGVMAAMAINYVVSETWVFKQLEKG